jgi:hypothetical protein
VERDSEVLGAGARTVVIDKLKHSQRYQVWRFDPYHYCLAILVERYVLWLRAQKSVGDVMAESRGGKEDRRLKDSFNRVFTGGSVPPAARHVGNTTPTAIVEELLPIVVPVYGQATVSEVASVAEARCLLRPKLSAQTRTQMEV